MHISLCVSDMDTCVFQCILRNLLTRLREHTHPTSITDQTSVLQREDRTYPFKSRPESVQFGSAARRPTPPTPSVVSMASQATHAELSLDDIFGDCFFSPEGDTIVAGEAG